MTEFSTEYILFEEYKLFVSVIEQQSARRQQMNNFYITILSGLLLSVSIVIEKKIFSESYISGLVLGLVGFLGICICLIWHVNIKSYKQLAECKFKVIFDLEKKLPYPLYTQEWNLLKEGTSLGKYRDSSFIERLVPMLLSLPYLIILIWAILLIGARL